MLVDGTGVQYPIISFALANIATLYPDKVDDIGFFPQPGDSADKKMESLHGRRVRFILTKQASMLTKQRNGQSSLLHQKL
ncbi:hypothetical protein GCM10020331_087990 [Ectobacillus funiculus]